MKNKKIFRTLAALCTCLMLIGGFSVTAFAQGTDLAPTVTPAADATNDSNVVVEETEDSPPLTPEGNAALVDDLAATSSSSPSPPRRATTSTSSLTVPTRTRKPPSTS